MKLKKFIFKKVKSTNDTAIRLLRRGIKNGIISSDIQTKGKGQRGNVWISKKGNLFLTIFCQINNKLSLKKITNNNLYILKKIIKNHVKAKIYIKLPNDILLNKQKVCGILQETISVRNRNYLIVGIGINLINNPKLYKYLSTNIFIETNIKLKMSKIIKLIKYKYENLLNSINNKKLLKV